MTTLYGSKKDLTVSIAFFVLVAGAIAVSTLLRGSKAIGIVALVVALALVVLAVVAHRRPPNELRIASNLIELHRSGRTIGALARAETGGSVTVRRHISRGRAFWSLVPEGGEPESGFPVDDFVPDEIRANAEQHGWAVAIIE